ncbi:MAG: hypothetical protein DLM61_21250 [Pseudonocardiales bacterium]|nr:MAG: hypothetical protein DLM61_21250 [Pseudonocardiales bacterium]
MVAALPALMLVMASYAARGLLDAAVGAVQAVLAPRVELRAQDELHAAVVGADLVAFDDADFVELVRRTLGRGIISVGQGIADAGNLLSSAISLPPRSSPPACSTPCWRRWCCWPRCPTAGRACGPRC